jgi:hypothetical protein
MKVSYINEDKIYDNKGGNLSRVSGIVELDSLHEFATLLTNIHVAPAVFLDNRKRQDHLQTIEFISFDFDDGKISASSVHEQLKNRFNHVIAGSKNCYKDKGDGNGERERFHLFIPTDKPITNADDYKYICAKFAEMMLWIVDNNCIEASRYFYKHPFILTEYTKAGPISTNRFFELRKHELEKEQLEQKNVREFFTEGNESPEIKFRYTKYFKMMESGALKADGERYSLSSKIIGAMITIGLNEQQSIIFFDEFSTYGKSFTRDSIVRRIQQFGSKSSRRKTKNENCISSPSKRITSFPKTEGKNMLIKSKSNGNYTPCPEYNGVARIVDATELKTYTGKFGTKEGFRFILEINEKMGNGKYHTVSTKPFTLSLHEKSSLRKFIEKVNGRPLTQSEIESGIDTDSLIGRSVNIVVEQNKTEDGNVFSNITYYGKSKEDANWKSDYIRFSERNTTNDNNKLKLVADGIKSKLTNPSTEPSQPSNQEVKETKSLTKSDLNNIFDKVVGKK